MSLIIIGLVCSLLLSLFVLKTNKQVINDLKKSFIEIEKLNIELNFKQTEFQSSENIINNIKDFYSFFFN